MATLYKIRDWDKHFEKSGGGNKPVGPLPWVAVPTKTDGLGFGRLRQQKNRVELLAAWYLLLGVAAKQPIGERGNLSRGGVPLTSDDLELMTGFEARIFSAAFEFFTKPEISWLSAESVEGPPSSGDLRTSPVTGQDRTGQTGQDKTSQDGEIDAQFERVWQVYPKKSGKKEARKEVLAAIKAKGFDALLAAVNAYAAAVALWAPADRQYVPDPVRWFKRGHYDDDPATWQRGNSTGKQLPLMR